MTERWRGSVHPPYCTCAECDRRRTAARPAIYQKREFGIEDIEAAIRRDASLLHKLAFWLVFLVLLVLIAGAAVWVFSPEWIELAREELGLGDEGIGIR